ncbi:ABC transporter substrate-binding protein [Paenibacillus sp. OV219]|uniref:ABC transporter substrate-binding protein n=1 Tax=Paenibacillus sp. OV219 TaxID=1884377 RepID=UPI0008CE3DFA|nr:sugar ABC transporter substrate-binding protein [Paenibacillus sp. OV219]SEO12314.1 carbohydrate ABC transporter substrate-binding protein, CUT1 family [Paenibacillus sp. OV219]
MKKVAAVTLGAALIVGGLTGCGSKSNTNDQSNGNQGTAANVKIQFMHSMVEQDRVEIIQKMIDAFHTANPNITVEQVPVDEDSYQTKITALGGSGKLPETMELTQDMAKLLAKNEFLDLDTTKTIIDGIGEDNIYKGALDAMKTEDGANYTAVPMAGWVQGIFYNKKMFDAKGLKAPSSWADILAAAKAFNDPANKKYGIALPTANTEFTEQAFSQFALSNGANVFDENGKANFDTPEMKAALDYYKELAQYTMPGSNDVPEVKDAFMSGAAPMAIYSTWILGSVYDAGTAADLGFVVPSNKEQAAFGNITGIGVAADIDDAKKDAAVKFTTFMLLEENNIKWLHMSPGGMQPILKSVASNQEYLNNDILKAFAPISQDISGAFANLKLFGTVNGKNFANMGDVTSKKIVSNAVYNSIIQKADVESELKKAQSEIEAID